MARFSSWDELFEGRHFDSEIIIVCVRWYLRFKSRVNVMLGFKQFKNAAITIAGIELMHRIRKGQFNLAARVIEATAPAVWKEVLSA